MKMFFTCWTFQLLFLLVRIWLCKDCCLKQNIFFASIFLLQWTLIRKCQRAPSVFCFPYCRQNLVDFKVSSCLVLTKLNVKQKIRNKFYSVEIIRWLAIFCNLLVFKYFSELFPHAGVGVAFSV